ncbi:MAG: hypothetical protein EP343_09650 [Deltaproteobacteria bacterium]|nr:MAG: hypothetical protein EP343_09650 [Deltaproteobacteria bacterium]
MWLRFVFIGIAVCIAGLATGCSGGDECQDSEQCGANYSCEQNRCKKQLNQDDCKDPNAICKSCESDRDCPDSFLCKQAICVLRESTCQTDKDCEDSLLPFCSPSNKCEWECKAHEHCVNKTKPFCSDTKRCEWSCLQDSDCGKGKGCKDNECVLELNECKADNDCSNSRLCSDAGKCEWECKTDLHCPVQRECQEHVCQRRAGVCESQSHCKTGEACVLQPQPYHYCGPTCDPKKTNNCAEGSKCYTIPDVGSFCLHECDPLNPQCPPHTFCKVFPIEPNLPQGTLCVPWIKRRGPGKLKESCGFVGDGQSCQTDKGIFCYAPASATQPRICAKACSPSAGFLNNSDCEEGESCVFSLSFYPISRKGGVCTVVGPQKEGEACSTEPYNSRQQCEKGLFCRHDIQGISATRCVKACDPKQGDKGCGSGQQCNPDKLSPLGGTCFLKQEGEGVPCLNQQSCSSGLSCGSFCDGYCGSFCLKACKEDSDCASNQRCFGDKLNERYCLDRCDLAKGASRNSACRERHQCVQLHFASALDSVCLPMPVVRNTPSPAQPTPLLQYCNQGLDDPCDTQKGQRCLFAFDGMTSRCYQMCDPSKGVASNPACGGAACMDHYNELGGICEPSGSRKLGEDCSLHQPCEKGLLCHGFKCVKSCDAQDNKACPSGQFCWRSRCVTPCDPKQGVIPNPSCRNGQLCWTGWPPDLKNPLMDYEPPFWKPYCRSLSSPVEGKIQPGSYCPDQASFGNLRRLEDNCDERQGYVCGAGLCRKACDPYKGYLGNPACAQGQACMTVYRNFYHLKTFWRSKPPSSLGGYCAIPCDPYDPLSSCPANHSCRRTGHGQAVCVKHPSKQQGPREKGESCRVQACNSTKGLFCSSCDYGASVTYPKYPGWDCSRVCRPVCDPTQSQSTCGASEDCLPYRFSYTGGGCWPKPHKKLGESCDSEDNRCTTGLRCYNSYDNPFSLVPGDPFVRTCREVCVPSDEQIGKTSCPKGFGCFASQPYHRQGGLCARLPVQLAGPQGLGDRCTEVYDCDGTKGLTCLRFGKEKRCAKSCDSQTGKGCDTGQVCVISPYSQTGAVCIPAKPTPHKEGEFCLSSYNQCESGLSCVQYRCVRDRAEGQLCHSPATPCAKGLSCWGDRCFRTCDIQQGTTNNSTCQTNEVCQASKTSERGGVCLPK